MASSSLFRIACVGAAAAAGLLALPAHADTTWSVQIGVPGPQYYQVQPGYIQYGHPAYGNSHGYYGPPPHARAWGRRDRDRDGVPNRYDRDRDGDGVPNRFDRRPNNPRWY